MYRDGDGNEHQVEWVTEQDLDLARRISAVAAEHDARPDTAGIMNVELALDTAHEERLAPFWSALLTGGQAARGRGTIGNDVRDGDGRVPYLWFQETEDHETPRQRFHLDVFVPGEHAQQRIAAALEAGGVVVSEEDGFTILADPDGNKACVNLVLGGHSARGSPQRRTSADRSGSIGSSPASWSRTEISSRLSRAWASPGCGAKA